ncbi:MAG TPA: helix-turn-helix transcriptional regulator [Dongiaceae bacterium]|nr:helix-turn-helix transcriptional regulator [Dongiaceae bacterium]
MDATFSPMRQMGGSISIKAGTFNSDGLEIETPWHYHDLHQLLYAFEDSVEVEGESARYKVPHQFAAWIPAGTPHRTTHKRVRSGSIFFRPDMIEWPVHSLRVIPVSTLMREMIIYAMRWPIDGEDDALSVAYFDCFARLCSEWLKQEVTLVLPSSDDHRINVIADFTRANLSTVTLNDVCKNVGMSERSLRRHFHKAMGISWEDFRLRLRIYKAIDELDTTKKPIGEIAADVGYSSQTAFAKAFRSIMGMGPTAYRRVRS